MWCLQVGDEALHQALTESREHAQRAETQLAATLAELTERNHLAPALAGAQRQLDDVTTQLALAQAAVAATTPSAVADAVGTVINHGRGERGEEPQDQDQERKDEGQEESVRTDDKREVALVGALARIEELQQLVEKHGLHYGGELLAASSHIQVRSPPLPHRPAEKSTGRYAQSTRGPRPLYGRCAQ